ncbi:hypothetical protein [Bowmanella denitrificans]|uniref:hypothetical protein n=1 Tax=Bowmanella denitrificans TaxID=366582 RepID=UPI000C9AE132|nr:hypothetical protein [Bowmanella denitrificans]
MSRILEGDQWLAAAVETNYGEDASPTAAANAMRVKANFDIDVQAEEMNYDAGKPGAKGQLEKYRVVQGSLEGYLAPSGTATVPPALVPLLRGAGFNVNVGASSVDLSLVDPMASASVTGKFYRGLNRRDLLGMRSDWEIGIKKGGLATLKFPNARALYSAQAGEAALLAPDFSAYKQPYIPDPVNFTVQNVFGYAANIAEVMIKGNNEVVYSPENGVVMIVDRKVTFDITFEEPNVATRDFESELFTYGALALQLGEDVTDEGKIFEVAAPNAQLVGISRTFINKVSYLQAKFECIGVARNDELTAKFR